MGTATTEDAESVQAPGLVVPERLDRLRLLVGAAMGTVLLSYAALVPVAWLIVATAGGSPTVDSSFTAALPLWLAAHQVPLVLDGVALTVLPLLPTVGLGVLVAAGAAWVVRRLGGRPRSDAAPVIAAITAAHGAVAVLVSALLPPSGTIAAAPWAAMLCAGVVAGSAAAVGVLRRCGPPGVWLRAPEWARTGLRATALATAVLAAGGALLLLVALLVSAAGVHDLLVEVAPESGAAFGLILLSVCYLPNAVVAAMSWAAGAGLQIGLATASPLGAEPAALPGVPLLAAMPTAPTPTVALAVFLLPLLAGVAAGRRCARLAGGRGPRLLAVCVAALGVACAVGLLAVAAGGRLAGGPFDPVRVPAAVLAGLAVAWIALPAALVVLVRWPRMRPVIRRRPG